MDNLFFYDEQIKQYEKDGFCNNIIDYLEKLFTVQRNEKILCTLIGYLWYFLIDEDGAKNYKEYVWQFMHKNLIKYLRIGLESYSESIDVCFISGYVLYLHWMNIDVNYENKGKKLLQDIVKIDSKTYIRLLAAYIISNRKTELQNDVILSLFPTSSMLDQYFKTVL